MKPGDIVRGQAFRPTAGKQFEWIHGELTNGRCSEDKAWVKTPGGQLRLVYRNTMILVAAMPQEPAPTVRARVLDEAKRITAKDRNSAYGDPEDNFQRIADFWSVWLGERLKDGEKITPGDTAAMMIMVKLAREMNAPKEDNKTDGAGYFACWAEVDSRS